MNRKLPACSHPSWGEVWPGHVAAIFDHLVEVGIHGNVWVGTLSCTGEQPLSFYCHNQYSLLGKITAVI